MAKFFGVVLTITLLAFANLSQAQTPQPKPISQGPDYSGLEKGQPTNGELNPFQKKYINSMRGFDPARANKFEAQLKQKNSSIDRVSQAYKNVIKIREQIDSEAILYRDGLLSKKALIRSINESDTAEKLLFWAEENYKSDLKKRYGPAKKTAKRAIQKFQLITDAWYQKFSKASAKKREKMGLPKDMEKWLQDNVFFPKRKEKTQPPKSAGRKPPKTLKEDIKKNRDKREVTNKARKEDRRIGRTPAQQAPPALACDVLGGEWRSGTLAKVRQIATRWKNALSTCSAGTRGCRMHRGGSSFGAYMKTLTIWQCHASFVRQSKKGSKEDKKLAREEGCAIEQTLNEMAEQIKATGFMTVGASWKPLHIDMSEKWKLKDLCDTENIEEASRGSGNEPKIVAPPVAEAKPKKDCKGGGLVGAMNCVTERIEGAGGSGAKTADTPSDSASPTGNRRPRINKDRSPAFASSTDPSTGETITSVGNPDGTRTVTKTDKAGNILSRETVGNSPDSASSTVQKTQVTTRSVANPDGSRTVTKTDKDGNILSREKVR